MTVPEPQFPIRLLVLDLDGTLIGDDLVLGARTRRAMAAATLQGVSVSLATGRMASSAAPFAAALGLVGPLIAYQGALVREVPQTGQRIGKLIFHRPLPAAAARADDPRAEDYSAFLGAPAELVPDLAAWVRHPVSKVLAVSDAGGPLRLLRAARREFAGRAEVTVSHPQFLEFVAPGVSKGRALRWLAHRIDVPLEQTMAIGDQFNDLEMIAAAGHGVAMPSAPPDVQAVARYVAPPVAEEGAAVMIERLVLGRHG